MEPVQYDTVISCVAAFFIFRLMFYKSLFLLFVLAVVLSALLQFTACDYPFGIFKLYLDLFWGFLFVFFYYPRATDFTRL